MIFMEKSFHVPILMILFNRSDTTARVFEAVRKARPEKLFIAADGPRTDRPEDAMKCREVRAFAQKVDWPCEVKTLFQEKNLGCGLGPVTAINWFFKNVPEGIILEDDCLPDPSFFPFCEELLSKYRNDERVMHISGNNFQNGKKRGRGSYYFSEYTHNWGWATWARAWKYNDFEMIAPEKRSHIWDKQWLMSVRKNKGLAILPNVNLVSNIGTGENATHTSEAGKFMNLPAEKTAFPLIHPTPVRQNICADFFTFHTVFKGNLAEFLVGLTSKHVPEIIKKKLKKIV